MSELRTDKILNTASGTSVKVDRTSSDGSVIDIQKDGTTVGSIASKAGDMVVGTGDTALRYSDASDVIEPWNVTSNAFRDNAIDLGYSANRFKNLYLSGNIYLGGTGSANALDDYEEGTWTPSLTSSGGSISVSYGSRGGKYTKVGNIVQCSFAMRVASHSGGSGEYRVSGLPFSASTGGSDHNGVTTAGLEGHPFTASTQLLQVIDNNQTYIRLLRGNDISSWNSYIPQSLNSIYMSFTYTTS